MNCKKIIIADLVLIRETLIILLLFLIFLILFSTYTFRDN